MTQFNKPNIKVYGADFYWAQVARIKQGFISLKHSVNEGDYDFVYSNNFDYSQIDEKHKDSPLDNDLFKIFNVLDIPPHDLNFPLEKLKNQLDKCDVVTCISHAVQDQLLEIGVKSEVIFNPIKDVFFDPSVKRQINCLYVGRASDSNKRVNLLSNFENECVSVGPFHNFGQHQGLVSDVVLNQLYNSSKVVALPSKFEGLGLPALEAMVCGALPLVCNDNPNSKLCPDFCICDPDEQSVQNKYRELLNNFEDYQKIILKEYSNQIAFKFSKFKIAQNILDVYHSHEKNIRE